MTLARPWWALLCAATLATLAGCSAASAEPTVATASHPVAAVPSESASPKETDYDKALRYTRCMTTNGVPTADPVEGEALVTVNIIHVGDTEAVINAKRTAFVKCKQDLPATWPLKVDPKEVARTRKFVACVRQHGLDWPEAGANGIAAWPTDPQAMTTPAYDAAIRVCRKLLDDPANGLPENQ